MTKRGGVSYGRQTVMLFASAIMLALTFLAPLSAYAQETGSQEETPTEEQSPQAPVLPYFTQSDIYRVHAGAIEFRTLPEVKSVEFDIGDETIVGQKVEPSEGATSIAWHVPTVPTASGIMTAKTDGEPVVDARIMLHDAPVVSLEELPKQGGETVVIRGSVNGTLAGTSVIVKFNGTSHEVAARGTGIDLVQISLVGLADGEYSVELIASDGSGDVSVAVPVKMTVSKPLVVPDPPDETPVLPVKPPVEVFLPKLEVTPIKLLSTDFSVPVAANIIASTKRATIAQSTAASPLSAEARGIATTEQETLEKAVDLAIDEPSATPLAPTSGGWSLFGVSWYWLAGSAAAIWLAGAGFRTWLRKP
ncbi:hypothetical protein I8H83_03820 [Candidatus Saccharibacteria bacterium]|nr:hypothetical protein [Candidatus Saccharibacteria bacterium]